MKTDTLTFKIADQNWEFEEINTGRVQVPESFPLVPGSSPGGGSLSSPTSLM